MNPLTSPYLPLRSPSYFDSSVFWIAASVATVLIIGVSVLVWRADKKQIFTVAKSNADLPDGVTPTPPRRRAGAMFYFLAGALVTLGYMSVTLVMDSVPAYASIYHKVNENIKAKYLIEDADVEVPEGVKNFTLDPANGNTLTRVNATVVQDGKVLVISYHVDIDKETGEPTLKSVIDSPAFSITPDILLRK